jgi:hypothetical protein
MAIGRARIAVFGLLAIARLAPPACPQEPAAVVRAGEHRIPFQAHEGLIYIQARVNGNRTTLLVDTGAALTTFSLKAVPTQETNSRITINMAKGSVTAFRISVGFILGESNLREEHCSFRQNAIVGDFKFMNADGVVGIDVLASFKSVTFDFKNAVLILEDR